MIYLQEGLRYGTWNQSTIWCVCFLIVAVSHNGHHDSLVRGIVICYTKSVRTPHGGHGGSVVCTPVERGRARCCGDSSKLLLARGVVAVCIPPHPSPSSPCTSSAWLVAPLLPHSTVRAPWPKIRWMEEDCFGIAQFHGMQPLQCVVGSASPKNLAAPNCLWTSTTRCIRWIQGILQIRYRCAAYSDAGRWKQVLIKWLCRNGFP
jgi:hypothetical protein